MNLPTLLLTIMGIAAAAGADAQQLYKSVGPDGKITFSDRPPSGIGKVSVMRSNVLRPLEPEAPAPGTLADGTPKVAARPAGPRAPASPELEAAVTALLQQTEVTKKFEPFCSPNLQAGRDYNVAVYNWRKRNASFLEQQNRILMEVISPIKRAEIQRKVDVSVDPSLTQALGFNPAGRGKWCERAVLEMSTGLSDVEKNPLIATPLLTYKFN